MMREMGPVPALPDVDRDDAESSSERRVVVTGLGAVTPLGSDIETTWRRLVAGECASSVITAFAPDEQPVRIACEVGAFDPERWVERRTLRRLDRFAQFAVAAARMAEADANLDVGSEPDRVGAMMATAQGGVSSLAECCRELGVRGPLGSPCTACAASAMAVGGGYDAIRLGRAEVMLCGGSEAGITPLAMAGFAAMRALSRRNDDPAGASRP